jgi:cation transport regulator ChaB
MPRGQTEIPGTILRSDKHAQRIWTKSHDSAIKTYGEGGRAHRVAYAALKHQYEKKGDRWVPKGWKGPSDPQAAQGVGDKPKPTARGKVARSEKEARGKAMQASKEYAREYRAGKKGRGRKAK